MAYEQIQPGPCSRNLAGATFRMAARHIVVAIVGISAGLGAFTSSGANAAPIVAAQDVQIASDGTQLLETFAITNLKPNAGNTQKNALISFDLSAYTSAPGFSQFASVTLQLGVPKSSTSPPFSHTVNRLKVDFVESEATWSEYSSGNAWAAVGGLGAADSEQIATSVAHGDTATNIAWANGGLDVTAAANAWATAQDTTQLGFLVYSIDQLDHISHQYYSTENTSGFTGPVLLVEVPEPATMLAPVIGTAILALRRRRPTLI